VSCGLEEAIRIEVVSFGAARFPEGGEVRVVTRGDDAAPRQVDVDRVAERLIEPSRGARRSSCSHPALRDCANAARLVQPAASACPAIASDARGPPLA
jgi:hypothetical protein